MKTDNNNFLTAVVVVMRVIQSQYTQRPFCLYNNPSIPHRVFGFLACDHLPGTGKHGITTNQQKKRFKFTLKYSIDAIKSGLQEVKFNKYYYVDKYMMSSIYICTSGDIGYTDKITSLQHRRNKLVLHCCLLIFFIFQILQL